MATTSGPSQDQPTPLPTEAHVSKCLTRLAETDETHAQAKRRVEGLKKAEKTILAAEYIKQRDQQKGKTTDGYLRELAYNSTAYRNWLEDYEDAIAELTLLDNKRDRWHLVIEFWRSLNSARTKGVIT